MRRHLLGIFGILFLAAALACLLSNRDEETVAGICLRVGLVLGAIWLAYPQAAQIAKRVPPWLMGCILLGGLAILVRPRTVLIVAPALAAIAILQFVGWLFKPLPRGNQRTGQSRKRD